LDEIKDLIVRNMTREECALAIEWAAKEGWNPGIHDTESFYASEPPILFRVFVLRI